MYFHNPNCQTIFIIHCHFKEISQTLVNVIVVSIKIIVFQTQESLTSFM